MFTTLPAIAFPMIDPVLFAVGPLSVRWYSLAYVAGLLIGWAYLAWLNKFTHALNQKAYDDIVLWAIFGIIIGGRLGYVLFYNESYYWDNPGEIIAVWKGGMSFHGGLIGVITSIWLMCRRYGLQYLRVMDLCACMTPIGLCLGRIANFINAELVGRVTDVPWAVLFPGHPEPRHPSQLYQSATEGVLLFLILLFLFTRTRAREYPGMLAGAFLSGYAVFRFGIEFFRQPDSQLGFVAGIFSMGQMLCIPMLLLGVYLMVSSRNRRPAAEPHAT